MTVSELGEFVWRKSSYSGSNGACVEVGWRKSSYSAGNGECVEMRWPEADRLAVRDSKAPQTGMLAFGAADWQTFLSRVRA
ncbi:MAG TPA: DUF397 domain-containing protein [Pseudonocardiaceae bacterium]|jgi:hypothetical protein|nr:DUF397 domain-containing protein [Pseudonocardiaceae bacterium]